MAKVVIVVEVPDHADQNEAQHRLTTLIERATWQRFNRKIIINDFARVVEYHRDKTELERVEEVFVAATPYEALGKLEFDGVTYGVEVTKDGDKITNVRFTTDPPPRGLDRVRYEWFGRLEKDR
jgi:hypothetical protein